MSRMGQSHSAGSKRKRSRSCSPYMRTGESTLPSQNPDELNIGSSSESEYGPSAPQSTKQSATPRKRVFGPSLPPSYIPETSLADPNSSSEDDDFGPAPPPAPGSEAAQNLLSQRVREDEIHESKAAQTQKLQRADWMIVPPANSDWTSRVDPTKLKNRKFNSGKGARAPAEKGGGISAIWTETPEEKRARLKDEVLGRKDVSINSKRGGDDNGKEDRDKVDVEAQRRIREYNERNRGKSLMEEHKGRKGGVDKEDDPSRREFDKEKDMGLGGRIGHVQKMELLSKAANFGSRFQQGKYL